MTDGTRLVPTEIMRHATALATRVYGPETRANHELALDAYPAIRRYCSGPNPSTDLLSRLVVLSTEGASASTEAGLLIYNACVPPEKQMTMSEMMRAATAQLDIEKEKI
jgi:hypothetical protein